MSESGSIKRLEQAWQALHEAATNGLLEQSTVPILTEHFGITKWSSRDLSRALVRMGAIEWINGSRKQPHYRVYQPRPVTMAMYLDTRRELKARNRKSSRKRGIKPAPEAYEARVRAAQAERERHKPQILVLLRSAAGPDGYGTQAAYKVLEKTGLGPGSVGRILRELTAAGQYIGFKGVQQMTVLRAFYWVKPGGDD